MKNLKKKITVILFYQHLRSYRFLILVPQAFLLKADVRFKFLNIVRYALLKGSSNSLLISNTRYANFQTKKMFLDCVRNFRSVLVGVKISNLYFFASALATFNYLHFFNLKSFGFSFKMLFYFMFNYWAIFGAKSA